jgi:formylglycine-generating enzyme required for sulfatase activity
LPTEAEWEYACRAGTTTVYSFGDTLAHDQANFRREGGKDIWDWLMPVKQFPPNSWGLYDMHGNVWEWCSSLDAPYPYKKDDGREDPKKLGSRILRGGSWVGDAALLRSAFRYRFDPGGRYYVGYLNLGFRCACRVRGEDK